jgi:hypothetical protein
MKKLAVILIMSILCFSLSALQTMTQLQKRKTAEIPEIVKEAFKKDYSDAKRVKWNNEDNDFEAEFKINGTACSANYNSEGQRTESEMEIKPGLLPHSILDYIFINYPDHKISEAAQITGANDVLNYEAELKKGGKYFDLIFDADGLFLSKKEGN